MKPERVTDCGVERRFQGLAVVLAKQKWPDLVACERKWDRGLDAYAPASLAPDAIGKGLASSLTAKLDKIKADAAKVREHFSDVNLGGHLKTGHR